jgi:hypothetical protein
MCTCVAAAGKAPRANVYTCRQCTSLHIFVPWVCASSTQACDCCACFVLLQVSQEEWDAVVSAQDEVNPFLRWSFLNALEVSGSAVRISCSLCPQQCSDA